MLGNCFHSLYFKLRGASFDNNSYRIRTRCQSRSGTGQGRLSCRMESRLLCENTFEEVFKDFVVRFVAQSLSVGAINQESNARNVGMSYTLNSFRIRSKRVSKSVER